MGRQWQGIGVCQRDAQACWLVDVVGKANKDCDLLLPHARYGYSRDGFYVMRRRWDYFVEHLMGATPPAGHEIKPPAM